MSMSNWIAAPTLLEDWRSLLRTADESCKFVIDQHGMRILSVSEDIDWILARHQNNNSLSADTPRKPMPSWDQTVLNYFVNDEKCWTRGNGVKYVLLIDHPPKI